MSLIFPLLLCAQTQITLLHTFEGQVSLVTYDYNNTYQNAQYLNGISYATTALYYDNSFQEIFRQGRWYTLNLNNNTLVLSFWNENFQSAGTKSIAFPYIENYEVSSFSLTGNTYSTKLFNDDDAVEYLVKYRLTNAYTSGKSGREYVNMQEKLLLLKEDGTILYDFGTCNYFNEGYYVYYIGDIWMYTVQKGYYDWDSNIRSYQTDVYQINKQSPQGLSQISPAHLPAYPNPAISEINIPSPHAQDVRIYDMNGRLVDTRNGNGDVVNVNVSSYPSGNYIYQTQENSGVFIKQ